MKWKPAFLYKVQQVMFITIIWVIAGALVELHNAVNYDPASGKHFVYFIFGKNAAEHLLITAIGPFIGGILGGSFIIFYQREKLRGKTYGQKLLIHSLLYILFVSFCILVVGTVGALNNAAGGSFWEKFYGDVFSLRVLRLLVAWYIIIIMTIFLMDVSEKYGRGILKRLLMGKYYSPGKEERIFMFLDLKGSTTIAEKIGDELYFKMLRYFYQVANEAILNTHGEIYQYVGDEIVVSWEKKQGLKNANCLYCFVAIREAVQQQATVFTSNFGVIPTFKAGIHWGEVATGEIGSVKKDIVYSGDVLNTTARIVALCNQYKETLIISDSMYEELKQAEGFQFNYIASPVLRGKKNPLGIYGVKTLS
jgi:adenylate cyclase